MQTDRGYVTYEEVVSTACRLRDAGEKVTSVSVRAHLGRGSFSTLQKFLEKWTGLSEPTAKQPRANEMPSQLESLWHEAQRAAEARLASERRNLEGVAKELDEKLARMEDSLAASEIAKRHAEARLQDKNEEIARLSELLRTATARAECADADLKALRLEEMQNQKTHLDALRTALEQIESRMAPFDEILQKVHAGIEDLGTTAQGEIKQERSLWAKRIDGFDRQIAGLTKALRIIAEPVANISRGFDELEVRFDEQMSQLRKQGISDRQELRESVLAPMNMLVTTAQKLNRKAGPTRRTVRIAGRL